MSLTRKQLTYSMRLKIVGDKRFRTLMGFSYEQLNSIIDLVLDTRNAVVEEYKAADHAKQQRELQEALKDDKRGSAEAGDSTTVLPS